MSRRKPVPKFIPSPPPSPPSSPGAPFRQISTDMPPLPEDWRDVIDRMVSRDRHLTLPNAAVDREGSSNDNDCEAEGDQQSPVSTEFGTVRSFAFAPPSPCGSFDGEPVSRPDSPTPWARPGCKRRAQAEYRPPTPPLPRQRSRSAESGSKPPTVVTHLARSLPHPPERKSNVSPPLPAPKPIRPFPDVRKVQLPTPPPSWSTHEHPAIAYSSPGHGSPPCEKTSTSCSVGTLTQTPSPSSPYSEKNLSRLMRAVSEQPAQNPSVEQVRTKIELLPKSKSLPTRPGVFRQALARGLNGLKRMRALVASALLCR